MSEERPQPAQVFHPVEFIRDELLARGWGFEAFVARTLPPTHTADDRETARLGWALYFANAGVGGGLLLGADAFGLERAFGTSAGLWLRLEGAWLAASPDRRATPSDCEDLLPGSPILEDRKP